MAFVVVGVVNCKYEYFFFVKNMESSYLVICGARQRVCMCHHVPGANDNTTSSPVVRFH